MGKLKKSTSVFVMAVILILNVTGVFAKQPILRKDAVEKIVRTLYEKKPFKILILI